jgi:hypothetical protein
MDLIHLDNVPVAEAVRHGAMERRAEPDPPIFERKKRLPVERSRKIRT